MLEQVTTQGLTAAAALASAFLGPMATIIIGRRQIRANVLSMNCQTWIGALREDIAELMAKRIELSELYQIQPGQGVIYTDAKTSDEIMERIRLVTYRIELRLRPGDKDHDRLVQVLHEAPAPPNLPKQTAELMEATQAIIRKEWNLITKAK